MEFFLSQHSSANVEKKNSPSARKNRTRQFYAEFSIVVKRNESVREEQTRTGHEKYRMSICVCVCVCFCAETKG